MFIGGNSRRWTHLSGVMFFQFSEWHSFKDKTLRNMEIHKDM